MNYLRLLTSLLLIQHLLLAGDKLELGIGAGSIYFPSYMGSKAYNLYTLPIPYMEYSSEFLNVDEDGVRSTLFDIKDLELELSLGGSLPANSENTEVRKGMPDLALTFEFGPKLIYKIFEQGVAKLRFELPLRAVFATNYHKICAEGLITTPQLEYKLDYGALEYKLQTGAVFADKQYHNYFYRVAPEFETSTRGAYESDAGYTGWKTNARVSYRKGEWWWSIFYSNYSLQGAVYANSPLVETKDAHYAGAYFAYIFYSIRRD